MISGFVRGIGFDDKLYSLNIREEVHWNYVCVGVDLDRLCREQV
jgi:hypothetical protein